jgi:hypothetical protein
VPVAIALSSSVSLKFMPEPLLYGDRHKRA